MIDEPEIGARFLESIIALVSGKCVVDLMNVVFWLGCKKSAFIYTFYL